MAENNELLPQGIESALELGRYWIIGVTLGYHQDGDVAHLSLNLVSNWLPTLAALRERC